MQNKPIISSSVGIPSSYLCVLYTHMVEDGFAFRKVCHRLSQLAPLVNNEKKAIIRHSISKLPEITLPAQLKERLAQGHPWVYRTHVPPNLRLPAGTWVRVRCGNWS